MNESFTKPELYEIHITLDITPEQEVQANKIANYYGWKTSKIDRDPILGEGIKFYYTKYSDSEHKAYNFINTVLDAIGYQTNFKILRTKIEKIVYDRRF